MAVKFQPLFYIMQITKSYILLVVIITIVSKSIYSASSESPETIISKEHPLLEFNEDGTSFEKEFVFDPASWAFKVENGPDSCKISLEYPNQKEQFLLLKDAANGNKKMVEKNDLLWTSQNDNVFKAVVFKKSKGEDSIQRKCEKLTELENAGLSDIKEVNSKISDLFEGQSEQINLNHIPLQLIKYPFSNVNYSEVKQNLLQLKSSIISDQFGDKIIHDIESVKENMKTKFNDRRKRLNLIIYEIYSNFFDFCLKNSFTKSRQKKHFL